MWEMSFCLLPLHARFHAHVQRPVPYLQPETTPPPQRLGFLDFAQTEQAAVKGTRLLLGAFGYGDLRVMEPEDGHQPNPLTNWKRPKSKRATAETAVSARDTRGPKRRAEAKRMMRRAKPPTSVP